MTAVKRYYRVDESYLPYKIVACAPEACGATTFREAKRWLLADIRDRIMVLREQARQTRKLTAASVDEEGDQ